jgi:poly-gamma-glutamate capsule biosynthesis protein CapA/YwtB (metallophosphatase superfamily)
MIFKKLLFIFILLIGCISRESKKTEIPVTNPEEARLLFGGDVMLDWGIKDTIEKYGPEYSLKYLKNFLSAFNYRFCNLESPITADGEIHPEKKYVFRGNPEHIELLKYAGINGIGLANNHALDMGKTGLINTIEILKSNNINTTGAGADMEEARMPATVIINNIKIAILAYAGIAYENSFAGKGTPGIAPARPDFIAADIKKLRPDFDFILISIHWANEYSEYPTEKEIKLGHHIIDSGADAVIGHHPHIFQGIEIYKGKPVFYSLGNFIFGSVNEDAGENILVELSLEKKKIRSFAVFPINGNGNSETHFQYKLLEGEHANAALNHLLDISMPLKSGFQENAVIKEYSLEYNLIE